jgi:K+ transporter
LDHVPVTSILAAVGSTASVDDTAADGVLVVFVIIGIWLYTLRGKGQASSRFAGIMAIVIAVWLLLGAYNTAGAETVISGLFRGLRAIFSAMATLLR